jgi:ATP adenylyltransferase
VERLWTPWRMEYIQSAHELDGCIFCDKPTEGRDETALILARTERAFVMLNAFPYNPGHLMVAPRRHVAELEALDEAELRETSELLQKGIAALKKAASPDGFNLGMNLGRVAGAGVPGHLHWHVVPRWNGDTNFMPIVGETRVLPEALPDTYSKLEPLFRTS